MQEKGKGQWESEMQRKETNFSLNSDDRRISNNNTSIHWARPIKMLLKQNCYLSLFQIFDF